MSNFHFTSGAVQRSDITAKREWFLALPPEKQAEFVAQFEVLRATAAAVRARRVEAMAKSAVRAAQVSSMTP